MLSGLCIVLFGLIICISLANELSGKWVNTVSSEASFEFEESGNLKGVYTSDVGVATSSENLVGKWSGGGGNNTILAFTVAWTHVEEGNLPSITTWAGFVDKDTKVMKCTWLLVSNVATEDAWQNTIINQAVFTKI